MPGPANGFWLRDFAVWSHTLSPPISIQHLFHFFNLSPLYVSLTFSSNVVCVEWPGYLSWCVHVWTLTTYSQNAHVISQSPTITRERDGDMCMCDRVCLCDSVCMHDLCADWFFYVTIVFVSSPLYPCILSQSLSFSLDISSSLDRIECVYSICNPHVVCGWICSATGRAHRR